jgi:hypothetical protein
MSAFADGEITGRDEELLRQHLETCECCGSAYESILALQTSLTEGLKESCGSPDITEAVMALLPHQRRCPTVIRRLSWAACATAVAAAVAFVFLSISHPNTKTTATRPVRKPSPTMAMGTADRRLQSPAPGRESAKPAQKGTSHRPRLVRKPFPTRKRVAANGKLHRTGNSDISVDEVPRIVRIAVSEEFLPTENGVRRTRITTTVAMNGVELSHDRLVTATTLPPDEDAASIERPPLRTVAVPRPSYGPDGS